MNVAYSPKDIAFIMPTCSVWRHDLRLCKPGFYTVIAKNLELARMQGAKAVHPACVVNDYGDLVAVPMTHGAIQ